MRRKVYIKDLDFGMYVDELDRPWVETPFLFQGFPIREQKELDMLAQHCKFAYVYDDRDEKLKRHKPAPHRFQTAQLNIAQKQSIQPRQDHHHLIAEIRSIKKTYDQSHGYITQVLGDVKFDRTFNISDGKALVEKLTSSIIKNDNALMLMSQLKEYDEYTVRHSLNVCIMSIVFGKHLNLKPANLRVLGLGALLHDIGKMKIASSILNKPGTLSDEEYSQVKQHPEYGYRLLKKRTELNPAIAEIARSHHERIDGSGYPRKLKANTLNTLSMIVAIIDVYDAITTKRCYHNGISPHEAIRLMYESELGAFRRDLLDQFIQCLSIFPIGSIVELSTDEIGIVMSVNRNRNLLPVVLLVLSPEKQPYCPRKVCNLELMADNETPIKIRKILESDAYDINVAKVLFDENNFDSLELI